ncbi:MAG: hypothetical protein FWE68_01390, partial [Defluviitaleaceae bacterium]|nr:hypothetical protein [Defluviitaleaceae bacterium]
LEMTVEICRMSDSEVDRVVQLCNKTNQFNLTAKCYDRRDILAFAEDPKAMVLTVRCRDKFGDNGLTGVMIVKEDGDTAYIDSFLLSCRVMGRAIEDHVVAAVVKHYKDCGLARGVTQISAAFIPTGKNKPVERLYDRLGFQIVSESNERTEYMFKIENVFLYPEQMYKKLIISAF